MQVVYSLTISSGSLIGKMSRPSEMTQIVEIWPCVIALWKCGLWEKFNKIRFGEDRGIIHAVPVKGEMQVVDSVPKSSVCLIGKKSRPSEMTQFVRFRPYVIALCKCGLWKKFNKIRYGRDKGIIHAVPVRRDM